MTVGQALEDSLGDLAAAAYDRLGCPETLISVVGSGVIGGGKEYEREPCVALLAGTLPEGTVARSFEFGLRADGVGGVYDEAKWAETAEIFRNVTRADAAATNGPAFFAFADPAAPVLEAKAFLDECAPKSIVVGGLTCPTKAGVPTIALRDRLLAPGTVAGVALRGPRLAVHSLTAQGATPLGPVFKVTKGSNNLVTELDNKPALAQVQRVANAAVKAYPRLARLLKTSLLVGLAVDKKKQRQEPDEEEEGKNTQGPQATGKTFGSGDPAPQKNVASTTASSSSETTKRQKEARFISSLSKSPSGKKDDGDDTRAQARRRRRYFEEENDDFLVRTVIGATADGAIAIGDNTVSTATRLRLHVRDGQAAREDLDAQIRRYSLERSISGFASTKPAAVFLVSCNGRGKHMYGLPNYEVDVFSSLEYSPKQHDVDHDDDDFTNVSDFSDIPQGPLVPVAGFFANGELGPIGARIPADTNSNNVDTHLHGFTSVVAFIYDTGSFLPQHQDQLQQQNPASVA